MVNRYPRIIDPGLAAHLLNADEDTLARDATLVGQLFETFIASEIRPPPRSGLRRHGDVPLPRSFRT